MPKNENNTFKSKEVSNRPFWRSKNPPVSSYVLKATFNQHSQSSQIALQEG
jgi:hypothetical protein